MRSLPILKTNTLNKHKMKLNTQNFKPTTDLGNDAKPVLSAGWISVKEQLPECWNQHRNNYGSGYVLGYTKYGEWEITQLWNNKDWEGDDENEGDYITHWMPLTVPPTCR